MSKICFVTYEIHPTTRGGCGVLLHHAAELLLKAGHEVVFLLAVPEHEFEQFVKRDRLGFSNPERCRAFHLGALCEDFTLRVEDCPSRSVHESARFAHACRKLLASERFEFVEFFEYCGVGYYAMARRLFGRETTPTGVDAGAVLGTRLHNSLELIDLVGSTRYLDRARYHLYALEHGQLSLSETVLTPTRAYFDAYYKERYSLAPSKVVVSQSPKLPFPRVTRRPDPAQEAFSIVFVGRLYQFKGVDQLVQAGVELLRRRPDLRCAFEIIGADSSESPLGHSFKEYLLSLIPPSLRDHFEFPGNLSQEDFSKRLDRALFAVFPNRFESFCYAAHEVYDAGVPMIVRDLPGWSDFFTHGRNALLYEGSTDDLVARMEEMIDDGPLRERLCRPFPIATEPLGSFYEQPRALEPLSAGRELPQVLAVVLCEGRSDVYATLSALEAQSHRPHQIVVLYAMEPGAAESFWWLGRAWISQDWRVEPKTEVRPASIRTHDALVILRAGDVPKPEWLKSCATALANRSNVAFAGTWGTRNHEGKPQPVPSILDLAPETYPFEHGRRTTRALIRTASGQPLVDLLDPVLAGLGEIGLIWKTVAERGPGVMLDEPLLSLAPEGEHDFLPPDPSLMKHLLAKYSHPFADRLALYAGMMQDRVDALQSQIRGLAAQANLTLPPATNIDPPLEHKVRVADELGGKTLARLAFKKLARKLSGNKPQG